MTTPRVAVIGAGIAGVAMTHALRGVGFEVELSEQTEGPRTSGYQINVLANGIYALSKLGLLGAVEASGIGSIMRSAPVYDGLDGRIVRRVRTVFDDRGEYAGRSCFRGDLHRVLLESMRGPGPVYGQRLRCFAQDRSSPEIAVEFSDGRTDRFDLLIGADGVHSQVRRALFPQHPGVVQRFATLLFMASIDLMGASEVERRFAEQVERGEFDMFNAPGTGVLLSHAGGGRFGIVIAVPDPAMATGITTPDDAKALALRLVRQVRDARVQHAIEAGIWEEGNPLIWLVGDIEPLPHYHAGAVALCGDAAHPMIPVVAQGANQSFEDAWRLAHHLEGIARSGDVAAIPAALDRYSRERAPHVAPIQREARRRMIFQRFRSRVAHRINMRILAWLPQNLFDRFDRHLLRYAIADPDCPIESF